MTDWHSDEARQAREDERRAEREAEGDGFYAAWKGWAGDPVDHYGHEDDYWRGYEAGQP